MAKAGIQYQQILSRLKKYCVQKNETSYSLSKKTGLSTSSLSNLMTGKTKPYVYTLICNALEIPMYIIFEEPIKSKEEKNCWFISKNE